MQHPPVPSALPAFADNSTPGGARPDPALLALDRLAGRWTTEATHPAVPGVIVRGTVVAEWLEGGRFLVLRSHNDHPDFPGAVSILGDMGRDRIVGSAAPTAPPGTADVVRPWQMHYFDSRGVFRVYETQVIDDEWRWWRTAAGFSQRFSGRFADGGATIVGLSALCTDGVRWADDLAITYRRVG